MKRSSSAEPSNEHSSEHEHRKTIIDSNYHLEKSQLTAAIEEIHRNDSKYCENANDQFHDRNVKRKAMSDSSIQDEIQCAVKKYRDKKKINECHEPNLNARNEETITANNDDKCHFSHSDKESAVSKKLYGFSSSSNMINEQAITPSEENVDKEMQSTESCQAEDIKNSPAAHRLVCNLGTRDLPNNHEQNSNSPKESFSKEVSKEEEHTNTQSVNVDYSSTAPQPCERNDGLNLPIMSSMVPYPNILTPLQLLGMPPGLQSIHPMPYSLHPFQHSVHPALPLSFLPFVGPQIHDYSATYHASAINNEIAQRIGHLIASNPLLGQSLLLPMINTIPGVSPNMAIPFGLPYGSIYHPPWPNVMPVSSFPMTANLNRNQDPNTMQTLQTNQAAPETENTMLSHHRATSEIQDGTNASCAGNSDGDMENISQHPSALSTCYTLEAIGPEVPESLPVILALPEDETKLSSFQYLLRQQIEFFKATENDIVTHARGRNKPIMLDQVGIRCKHCATCPLGERKKGAVYFPFTLLGVYQASQNMASSHFIQGNCTAIPSEITSKLLENISSKSVVGSGKEFWAKSGCILGLVDTEQGIRFIRDLVTDTKDSE
jgi:hypothetical protein